MSDQVEDGVNIWGRIMLAALGGLAGAVWWLTTTRLHSYIENPQLYLFVMSALAGFFGVILILTGPLSIARVLPVALFTALFAPGLLTWASLRHETLRDFFVRIDIPLAALILMVLPLPFFVAFFRPGRRWRDYPTLFMESWSILIRLGSAGLFVTVFWLAVFLANELLELAGVEIIHRLLVVPPVIPIATGMVAGFALAIMDEMEDFLSYSLVIRLIRLLVLPTLVIVGAFLGALPYQGYDALFGILSPAGAFLVIATFLTVLVSTAVGAGVEDDAISTLMRFATRGLALLLPVVAVLALMAIRVRIFEYGLSPGRLALGLAACVMLIYGVLYAVSALSGWRWMKRIRSANRLMAFVMIVLAALWLTPILNAERLSAEDQFNRFEAGVLTAETVDLWSLRHDWGRPGQSVLQRLASVAEEDTRLRERLDLVAVAPDRASFDRPKPTLAAGNSRAVLKTLMPVQPPEAKVEFDRFILPWYAGSVTGFLEGCNDLTTSGNPGCVLVVADLLPGNPGNEGILFYKSFGLLRGEVIVPEPIFRRADASEVFSVPPPDFSETDDILDLIQAGGFTAGPAQINAISIGERQFTVPY